MGFFKFIGVYAHGLFHHLWANICDIMCEHGGERTLREVYSSYFGVVSQRRIDDQLNVRRGRCRHGDKELLVCFRSEMEGGKEGFRVGVHDEDGARLWRTHEAG